MKFRVPLALSLPLLAGAAFGQSKVWVVDDDGGAGVDFTQIQPAIDAAVDGDVVLIRDGNYTSVVVDGKSLTVVGDAGGVVDLGVSATVRNVAVDQQVTLRNLRIVRGPLNLEDSFGPIWVDGVELFTTGLPFQEGSEGIWVSSCDAVSMQGVVGDAGLPGLVNLPGAMLNVEDSSVFAFHSFFRGNSAAAVTAGNDGFHGVHLTSGFVFLYGSEAEGGDGADGVSGGFGECCCSDGGDGGHGVRVEPGATLAHLDSTFTGGAGGEGGTEPGGFSCNDGALGQNLSLAPLAAQDAMGGASQAFSLDSPVREGETSTLSVEGASGMTVLLLASASQSHLFLPDLGGALVVGIGDYFAVPLGDTNAQGSLTVPLTAPNLPPGMQAAQFFVQPLYFHLPTGFFLGSGQSLEILDSAF